MTAIRRAVVAGSLRPGDKLTETGLATSLQVSRATIREAMNQLAQEGLLIAEPYRGLRVADLGPAAIRDIARTRVALDLLAVTEIWADSTGARMAALDGCWRQFEALAYAADPVVRHDAHLAFHRGIWAASGNAMLGRLWPVVEAHVTIVLAQDQAARPDPHRAHQMHEALMSAIATRDRAVVEAALVEHIITAADELLDLTAPPPPKNGRKEPLMKVLVIGSGQVGGAAVEALRARGHDVVAASRSGTPTVDATDPTSVEALFAEVGTVDAIVTALGSAPFKALADLSRDDYAAGFFGKVLTQLDVVRIGTAYLADGGSLTLTTGVLAREPIRTGAASSLANGALEAYVMAAAVELPRGIRINAVSPTVLVEATAYHSSFPGFTQVSAAAVGQAYVKAVEGVQTGQVYALDGQ